MLLKSYLRLVGEFNMTLVLHTKHACISDLIYLLTLKRILRISDRMVQDYTSGKNNGRKVNAKWAMTRKKHPYMQNDSN